MAIDSAPSRSFAVRCEDAGKAHLGVREKPRSLKRTKLPCSHGSGCSILPGRRKTSWQYRAITLRP